MGLGLRLLGDEAVTMEIKMSPSQHPYQLRCVIAFAGGVRIIRGKESSAA